MKRALGLVLLLFLSAAGAAAAEPEGFGDLRWGDPAPKRWQRKHAGDAWVHASPGRGSAFGKVSLERVEYEFAGGGLVGVVALFRERPAFLSLRGELDAAFARAAEPVEAAPASESFCWRGATTWAYANSFGEGVPGLLFLAPAPRAKADAQRARVIRESLLENRIRLYDHLDAVLGRSLQSIGGEIAWVDRALQEGMPRSQRCRDLQVAREQDQQREQRSRRDLLAAQDAIAAERARLGQEAVALRAELARLRAAESEGPEDPEPPGALAPPGPRALGDE